MPLSKGYCPVRGSPLSEGFKVASPEAGSEKGGDDDGNKEGSSKETSSKEDCSKEDRKEEIRDMLWWLGWGIFPQPSFFAVFHRYKNLF